MPTGKLLREVLVVLVAVLVEADESSGLGITCVRSAHYSLFDDLVSEHTNVLYVRASSISRVYGR